MNIISTRTSFPRLPFDGTWEVVGLSSMAVPDKPIKIRSGEIQHFEEVYFPAGTRIRMEVLSTASEARPELRGIVLTFLPPFPEGLTQHPMLTRSIARRDSQEPITWDAWLHVDRFNKKDAVLPFYQQFGVRYRDFRFSIIRTDKFFGWNEVFFKNPDTLVIEVAYYPNPDNVDKILSKDFEVVGMILERIK